MLGLIQIRYCKQILYQYDSIYRENANNRIYLIIDLGPETFQYVFL